MSNPNERQRKPMGPIKGSNNTPGKPLKPVGFPHSTTPSRGSRHIGHKPHVPISRNSTPFGNVSISGNGNPPPPSPPAPPAVGKNSDSKPDKTLVGTINKDDSDDSDGTANTNDTNGTNATDVDSDDSDDGGVSILEKMLSPPESDLDSKPQSKQQDIRAFHVHYAPTQRSGPFIPQRPDPSKERKGEFNSRRNKINLRRNFPKTRQASSDNDGDDEQDDDLPDNLSAGAPPSTPEATTHLTPPDTPRPMTRSQSLRVSNNTTSPTTATTPSPSQPFKRKRDDPNISLATPTKGERISKRRRNSTGTSPLPPVNLLKRTRAQQKKFEAKLSKDLIYDEEFPGSARWESVDVKVGAEGWRRVSLHVEPWDGSGK
jgi:hypothetical protein